MSPLQYLVHSHFWHALPAVFVVLSPLACGPSIEPAPTFNPASHGSGGAAGSAPACGDLQPWLSLSEASPEQVVIRGMDGFVGYMNTDMGVFSASGAFLPRIAIPQGFPRGVTVPVALPSGGETYDTEKTWMVNAAASGSTLAVLTFCHYMLGYCGASLFFSDRPSVSVDDFYDNRPPSTIDISTQLPSYAPGFMLGPSNTSVIAANVFQQDASGSWQSKLRVKRLDNSNKPVADISLPLESPDEIAQITGMGSDSLGHLVIVYSRRVEAEDTDMALEPGSRVLVLNLLLHPIGTWTAPSDVTVRSLSVNSAGQAVLGGNIDAPDGAHTWLQMLDLSTQTVLWPAPIVGGTGFTTALAFASNGDVLAAGRGATEAGAWLDRFTAAGERLWVHRSDIVADGKFLITSDSTIGQFKVTGVAEQSNGSIFVSSTATKTFQAGSPLTFPAHAAPPPTCSDTGGCDCAPRGWQTPP